MATQKKNKEKKTPVEFIKAWGRYVRKDIAGFDAETAQKLIDAKIAVKPGEAPAEEEKEDPKA